MSKRADRTELELRQRRTVAAGYPKAKWIEFILTCLNLGLRVSYYEAKTTRSKYVYVSEPDGGRPFKVRFSNHRPNKMKQAAEDSNFYVGISNGLVTTTDDAIDAVMAYFNIADNLEVIDLTDE
ncbi:MAG: hypothetical protein ACK5MY_02665 [Jhaorihella sp.]